MVKYAENRLHKLINKLVMVSLFVIIGMLAVEYIFRLQIPQLPALIVDFLINTVFIIDLVFIFQQRKSLKEFFWKNWLDILACIPLNAFFRAAKLVRLTRIFKLAGEESRILRVLPRSRFLNAAYMRIAKMFSRETDINRHIDVTKDKIFDLRLRKLEREMDAIANELGRMG